MTSTGSPLWLGPKKCPKPLVFDPEDSTHFDFVEAAANLCAANYAIEGTKDRDQIKAILKTVAVLEFIAKSLEDELSACSEGDKDEVKRLYELNPAILNQQDSFGWTGLMLSLSNKHHSVSRWLLGRPGIDTTATDAEDNDTALHFACRRPTPLEIVAQLAELSRRQGNFNLKNGTGLTGLDWAVVKRHPSIALHLAWLGADCKPFHRRAGPVKFQTWLDEGCQQQAQYWAVSPNDSEALDLLATTENVKMDIKNLRNLAKFFNHIRPAMNLALYLLNNSY